MSKLTECKKDNGLIKLKMVLQAMEFGETFGCTVLRSSVELFDEDEGFVTIILDMNNEFNLEEEK